MVSVPGAAVGAVGVPVSAGDASGALRSSAVVTNAVVASCVVDVAGAAVGAAGVPVKVGDARGAFAVNADCRSVWLLSVPVMPPHVAGAAVIAAATNAVVASDVSLSPSVGVGPRGLPVNTGDASGASSRSAAARADASATRLLASVSSASLAVVPDTPDAFVMSSVLPPPAVLDSRHAVVTREAYRVTRQAQCRP